MTIISIHTAGILEGPPELAWELLTDWEAQSDWMLEMSDVVVVSPHREGVGVEAEATVRIGGISTRDIVRVDVWEPNVHLGIVHAGWVGGRGDIHLTPSEDGTTWMDWREQLVPPLGPLGAAGMRLFRPLMARIFRRDLKVLQGIVRDRTRTLDTRDDTA